MLDWEFEKAGRVVKVSPPAKLIATYLGLAMRAVHDGLGFRLTFEGYIGDGVTSGAPVNGLDDWNRFCTTRAGASRRPRLSRSWPLFWNGANGRREAGRVSIHSMLGSTRSGGL
jgi:hypothetical protein